MTLVGIQDIRREIEFKKMSMYYDLFLFLVKNLK